jgi:hypothetical protein
MFLVLALTGGTALLGTVRKRAWRHAPLGSLWLGLALVAWYYWPS